MLSKILVAIDQSEISQKVFKSALELAQGVGSELTLIHALDIFDPVSPKRPTQLGDGYSLKLNERVIKKYDQEWSEFIQHFDALLKQKKEEANACGVKAKYIQPYGTAGQAICQTAEADQSDLIIMGSHGRRGLKRLVLGSVSSYVTHHAPCSVMVVHPSEHKKSHKSALMNEPVEHVAGATL